ncbi:calcium-binding protein [Tateyamaria sp. ANG-S1]|uniref:calcium-binding protein n=1 Tax=Tateyamaria sp. ANG-S1 TaxID=1577905 RepID=UPI000691A47D|nr:calcium-binding protein [Tateyamaria sp. ANG-S1]
MSIDHSVVADNSLLPFATEDAYRVPLGDDNYGAGIDLAPVFENGFSFFTFDYDFLRVNTNGNIQLGREGQWRSAFIDALTFDQDARVAPPGVTNHGVWVDLNTDRDSVVITWNGVGQFFQNVQTPSTYQIEIIDRGDGDAEIIYRFQDISTGRTGNGDFRNFERGDTFLDLDMPWAGFSAPIRPSLLDEIEGNTGVTGVWQIRVEDGFIRQADLQFAGVNPTATAQDDILVGGFGDDTLRGLEGDDSLSGGFGDDGMIGDAGNDTIDGGDGNDSINAGSGDDSVRGGAGNDSIGTADGDDFVDGGFGDDIIFAGEGENRIIGENGRDVITTGNGNDNIAGDTAEEDLTFDYFGGSDVINTGGGDDTVSAGAGNDTVHGSDGNDLILGHTGQDYLTGGDGNDTINGGIDNDSILGSTGDDVLNGQSGRDTVNGGEGDDLIMVTDITFERFGSFGSEFNGRNILNGGSGQDTITGSSRNDTIGGQDGDDLIDGNGGGDRIGGGAGNDTLRAGDWNTQGNDWFFGGEGDDSIFGGGGNDTLFGEEGNDTLIGSWGRDVILGGDGDDFIFASEGFDEVTGGLGADTFFASTEFTDVTIVTDYNAAEGNVLVLDGTVFDFENFRLRGDRLTDLNGNPAEFRSLELVYLGDDGTLEQTPFAIANATEVDRLVIRLPEPGEAGRIIELDLLG